MVIENYHDMMTRNKLKNLKKKKKFNKKSKKKITKFFRTTDYFE